MSFDVSEQKTISSINDFISKVEYSYYFKLVGLNFAIIFGTS